MEVTPPHCPPPTFSCVHLQQNRKTEQKVKEQSSSTPQTSGSFKTPLHSLSAHYQSIFVVFGMYLILPLTSAATPLCCELLHTMPTGLLSLLETSGSQCQTPRNYIQNDRFVPVWAEWDQSTVTTRTVTLQYLYSLRASVKSTYIHVPLWFLVNDPHFREKVYNHPSL